LARQNFADLRTGQAKRVGGFCGFTLLAIALVAGTIHMTAPNYASIRAGRVAAGYLDQTIAGNATKEITRRGVRRFIAR
jgi:DMSO reductase anchor subunit